MGGGKCARLCTTAPLIGNETEKVQKVHCCARFLRCAAPKAPRSEIFDICALLCTKIAPKSDLKSAVNTLVWTKNVASEWLKSALFVLIFAKKILILVHYCALKSHLNMTEKVHSVTFVQTKRGFLKAKKYTFLHSYMVIIYQYFVYFLHCYA